MMEIRVLILLNFYAHTLASPYLPSSLLQLVNAESYQVLVYLQVVLTNVALNQTWIALLIALICAFPAKAFRLSPIIAAVAGFSSGFFIPVGALHWG